MELPRELPFSRFFRLAKAVGLNKESPAITERRLKAKRYVRNLKVASLPARHDERFVIREKKA